MGRQRRVPVTAGEHARKRPSVAQASTSAKPAASRTVIRRYHVLLKRKAQLAHASQSKDIGELQDIEKELEELGGIEAYQHMSHVGQSNDRGGGSEKQFIVWMRARGLHKVQDGDKLKLLEVGALRPDNYASHTWIQAEPIDLHARVPGVREQDFLTLDPHENKGAWDAISLSLVLNFVPDAKDRGRMLRLCRDFLKPGGLLFVVLPLPCVLNSRYLTIEHFKQLTQCVGLRCLEEQWKPGRKMVYFLFDPSENIASDVSAFQKKRELLKGASRNNFCILL